MRRRYPFRRTPMRFIAYDVIFIGSGVELYSRFGDTSCAGFGICNMNNGAYHILLIFRGAEIIQAWSVIIVKNHGKRSIVYGYEVQNLIFVDAGTAPA